MLRTESKIEKDRLIGDLRHHANRLRILSIRSTTAAGSGHPTSCASAADIVSALFFRVMQRNEDGSFLDRFILSKGHAAPLLYAAWSEGGAIPEARLLTLRRMDSDLEGHPTPRLPFVDVATGSLGQGLCAGVGMALDAKYLSMSPARTYVLLGDGECAEGSVYEAAASAAYYGLHNLCAIIDVNRLGQSGPTRYEHDLTVYARQWSAFGWNTIQVDGHNLAELLDAFERAGAEQRQPSVILARTIKGQGIPNMANKEGFHGKALSSEEADAAIKTLSKNLEDPPPAVKPPLRFPERTAKHVRPLSAGDPPFEPGQKPVATRKAFGEALRELGKKSTDVVGLDGDVKNSTYTDLLAESSSRFFEMFIAEQDMVGAAVGLSAMGRIPFAATFACFLTRAYDFIRMAAIGNNNIKLVGTHAGVSIGEDGPSQMGLEDLAMFCAQPNFTVLYPSDAVSTWRAVEIAANLQGPVYIRTSRPATPMLYSRAQTFEAGRSQIVREHAHDRVTVVAAGITLFEALAAHDELAKQNVHVRVIDLFSVQPLDRDTILESLRATEGRLVTVEDHYARGGFGEAICAIAGEAGLALRARLLAVREIPHSGSETAVLDRYGISAKHIADAAKSLL